MPCVPSRVRQSAGLWARTCSWRRWRPAPPTAAPPSPRPRPSTCRRALRPRSPRHCCAPSPTVHSVGRRRTPLSCIPTRRTSPGSTSWRMPGRGASWRRSPCAAGGQRCWRSSWLPPARTPVSSACSKASLLSTAWPTPPRSSRRARRSPHACTTPCWTPASTARTWRPRRRSWATRWPRAWRTSSRTTPSSRSTCSTGTSSAPARSSRRCARRAATSRPTP
mmetsp:Transcript_117429/g.365720  ORF Transcript_117429/g.365720 Transcript_117429/m.365720 type:complete len:222 (+) Transcript_117429:1015-1680(+)